MQVEGQAVVIGPDSSASQRMGRIVHRGDTCGAFTRQGKRAVMRAALAGLLGAGVLLSGCVSPFSGDAQAAALNQSEYVGDVQVAVNSLGLVFAQADESVKLVQAGWLAPEGAASQFGLLHDQVKDIKTTMSKAEPPEDMAMFHRQLGRSVSLTQQAMDAMQTGFASNDPTYFELAGSKLAEARKTLDRAVNEL